MAKARLAAAWTNLAFSAAVPSLAALATKIEWRARRAVQPLAKRRAALDARGRSACV